MKTSHKFKVGDKVRFISKDSHNAKYFRCPIDNLEIKQINGDGYNIYDNVYNEDWFVEEVELELIPETYKYEVVHTETLEQWDFVYRKTNSTMSNNWFINKEYTGFCINRSEYCHVTWYRGQNSKIYTFEEWLDKFGHKSEYLKQNQKQEQWIPQVGDWIYSNRLGCWYYSDCKHPVKIVEIKDDKFRYDLFSNTKTNRFKKGDISEYYGFSGIVRKAFPHEIPTQELSKEDLLAEAERRYPVGTKYWNLNRAGGKSVPSNTIEELPVIGKNWKFEIADTDSIDGTDIIVVRDKEGMTHGWVYAKNTWAEIVEEPKIKSNKTVFDIEGYQQSDWSQVLHSTGKIIFEDGCAVKLVKNNKILPIKVRNSNITEPTELPKRTRIKIIKKQLLTI